MMGFLGNYPMKYLNMETTNHPRRNAVTWKNLFSLGSTRKQAARNVLER